MPERSATGEGRGLRRLRLAALVGLVAAAASCQIPPDVAHLPRYAWDFMTNPNFVVNAPVVHDLFGLSRGVPDEDQRARFRLPTGFEMEVFAEGIALARFMKVTPRGDVLLTQPRKRRVWLLERDGDGDGRSDGRRILLDGLHLPHGVELIDDQLYVAGPEYILRVGFDVESGTTRGESEIFARLPPLVGHASRPLRQGPDGWLYTAIGADCNVCEPSTERDQAILRFDLASGREEIVASGFRNAAHLDWQPETQALFATEVGADYAGEDLPLEELNQIETGGFYGFPYLHGPDYPDPEWSVGHHDEIARSTPPVHTFPAHSTPLGLTFLRSPALPEAYRGAALVVLKGSWNRSRKTGYKVVSLHWSDGEAGPRIDEREFLTGFERDEDVIGRPVDIVEAPDGTLYLSDEAAGAVYRIRYVPEALTTHLETNENTFAIALAGSSAPAHERLAEFDAANQNALRERGERLFERHGCGVCHGPTESGRVQISLAGLAGRWSLDEVVALIREPPASMPRFLLSQEERRALAVYLTSSDAN